MTVSERLLLTINPFLNTEGNTSSTLGRAMSPPQRGVGGGVVKAMISSVKSFFSHEMVLVRNYSAHRGMRVNPK